jgi:NADPH:quinone reductase-like Zn-dependent oxidoreductase
MKRIRHIQIDTRLWRKTMRAIVYTKYGSPEVMKMCEVDKPVQTDDEVLVKVHASSVNYSDWAFVRGKPFMLRLMDKAPFKPRNPILGADVAGVIEAVGKNVRQFQPGDEVYGDLSGCGWGGFAEYAVATAATFATKPANLTFEEAAAVPQASLVALQGLRDSGRIRAGQRVLINGASGGIGTFAMQIAKSMGAEVTGVCSTQSLDLVRSLGADHVIDYTQEDYAQGGERYDLILDIVASRSMEECERALSSEGMYVLAGGDLGRIIQASMTKSERIVNHAQQLSQSDLLLIRELIDAGKVTPVIDRCYPFDETAQAVSHYGTRHSQGKVVISVQT